MELRRTGIYTITNVDNYIYIYYTYICVCKVRVIPSCTDGEKFVKCDAAINLVVGGGVIANV